MQGSLIQNDQAITQKIKSLPTFGYWMLNGKYVSEAEGKDNPRAVWIKPKIAFVNDFGKILTGTDTY